MVRPCLRGRSARRGLRARWFWTSVEASGRKAMGREWRHSRYDALRQGFPEFTGLHRGGYATAVAAPPPSFD